MKPTSSLKKTENEPLPPSNAKIGSKSEMQPEMLADGTMSIHEMNKLKESKGEPAIEKSLHQNNGDNDDSNDDATEGSSSSSESEEGNKRKLGSQSNPKSNKRNGNSKTSSLRRMSRQLSVKLEPVKPETPLGWTAFLSTMASLAFIHEVKLQKRLTCPPLVYTQETPYMDLLQKMLSKGSKDGLSILTRNIQPSLFVGTRSVISSTAAYASHNSSKKSNPLEEHLFFREIVTMDGDGAKLALDWELPVESYPSSVNIRLAQSQRIANIKYGPINRPVVIILHGINNDVSFGYMRSLMRSCTDRGWIACGFNFRGCGNVEMTTPRGYNAGYTGDLRNVVYKIRSRLEDMDDTPIFIVGNSLGANVITKYLGEEGYCGTLPKCVKGGVSLGNPLHIHSGNLSFPWNILLGMGVKKTFAENWKSISSMSKCFHFKKAVMEALLSKTIGQLDDAMSPFLIRNETQYPFSTKLGFVDGEDYWHDASSNRYIQHLSVPMMILSSQDDFLVADPALRSLSRCLSNPNVLVVKTKCGGHLGWQEAPPSGKFGIGKSWADTAMADFFSSVLETNKISKASKMAEEKAPESIQFPTQGDIIESLYSSKQLKSKL